MRREVWGESQRTQNERGLNPNLPETYLASCEVRYPAAAGVGEEAQSRQSHWFPWSKTMNMETCGHVADLIVMAHAFAELRDGVVAPQHENGFKCGHNFAHEALYTSTLLHTFLVSYSSRVVVAVLHE